MLTLLLQFAKVLSPDCKDVPEPNALIVGPAGYNLSETLQFRKQLKQELATLGFEPASKRSRTGWQEFSTLPTQDCNEVKLWDAEVLNRNVSVVI